jgi:hypothetical protein
MFIYKNKSYNLETTDYSISYSIKSKKVKEKIQKNINRDYGIENGELFHLYSKKRNVIEKMFSPLTDLYEFKFYVVNHSIKLIYIRATYNSEL